MLGWFGRRRAADADEVSLPSSSRYANGGDAHASLQAPPGTSASAPHTATGTTIVFVCGGDVVDASRDAVSGGVSPEARAAVIALLRWASQRLAGEFSFFYTEFAERNAGASLAAHLVRFTDVDVYDLVAAAASVADGGGPSFSPATTTACGDWTLQSGEPLINVTPQSLRESRGVLCFCPFVTRAQLDPSLGGLTASTLNSDARALSADVFPFRTATSASVAFLPSSSRGGGGGYTNDDASVFVGDAATSAEIVLRAHLCGYSPAESDHGDGGDDGGGGDCNHRGPQHTMGCVAIDIQQVCAATRYGVYERLRATFLLGAPAHGLSQNGRNTTTTTSSSSSAVMLGGGDVEMTPPVQSPPSCAAQKLLRALPRVETLKTIQTVCKNIITSGAREERFCSLLTKSARFEQVMGRFPPAMATLLLLGFRPELPSTSPATPIQDAWKGIMTVTKDDAEALLPEMRRTFSFINDLLPQHEREHLPAA